MSHEFSLETRWSKSRLLMVGMSILGIGAALAATLTARDLRSSANIDNPSPTPLAPVITAPSPKTNLKAPYIRLSSAKSSFGFSSPVLVDVYAHTAGAATMEENIVISYDPDLLDLSKNDITNAGIYKVINTTLDDPGKAMITLFIDAQSGQTPVTLDSETKIMSLKFMSKTLATDATQVAIQFDKKNVDLTSLTEYSQIRKDNPVNLLNSVEGLTLSIHP